MDCPHSDQLGSCGYGFVDTAREFCFLVGLAEAGYFPSMVLYLTYRFPQHERARAAALVQPATPVTTILGLRFPA